MHNLLTNISCRVIRGMGVRIGYVSPYSRESANKVVFELQIFDCKCPPQADHKQRAFKFEHQGINCAILTRAPYTNKCRKFALKKFDEKTSMDS